MRQLGRDGKGGYIEMVSEEQKQYNNRIFLVHSMWYDVVSGLLNPIRRAIANLEIFHPGMRVLDMACGTGTQAIALAKQGLMVTGIDLSPAMLVKAQRKATVAGVSIDYRPPQANHWFDQWTQKVLPSPRVTKT